MELQDMLPMATKHSPLKNLLQKLGFDSFYPNKLTLKSLLEINRNSSATIVVKSIEDVPWYFLQKLLIVDVNCRDYTIESDDIYTADCENEVNPLDLITALFLCADRFLQQEMALKMSMCQFAIPFLLPQGSSKKRMLMLWALRNILKEWCPHTISDSKQFKKESVVHAEIPLISFVRLKDSSLSKSQLLNLVLSNGGQPSNITSHKDTHGGTTQREISNGMVEICWYLPCGNQNLDIFSGPLAIANLRGDICTAEAELHFLSQVSAAVFVFLDNVEESEQKLLQSLGDMRSKLFFIINSKDNTIVNDMFNATNTITKRSKCNLAKFSKELIKVMKNVLEKSSESMSLEKMSSQAKKLGILVDECDIETIILAAEEFVKDIGKKEIANYKATHLPLSGNLWKQLSNIEKEECRLKESTANNLEEYKDKLKKSKEDIRKQMSKHKITKDVKNFLEYLSLTDRENKALLVKCLQLKLSSLNIALGIEHYLREIGQIYETCQFVTKESSQEYSSLPGLVADLLLGGHPFELLDGDASNIPEKWLTDVLMELHKKVGEKSRLLVLSVLGVQSTGKSTLLNTMFGIQFPVSSGKCTRGAFMVFIPVGEDQKDSLKCDFILLIDTEGLKSPELAQLEDNCRHDNELATLVIGLSDVTIINIAMENTTEMKDVLQIAVHAFLRMKQIGKRPICHFVHQNTPGVSALQNTATDRLHTINQLNEMTRIAAEMERQSMVSKFSDVLEYDEEKNNWHIPGLWQGTPPMAPVNRGYSEKVFCLKTELLKVLKICAEKEDPKQIPEFIEWVRSLWKAVKYENFIFSFRNTLVANAYDDLCKKFKEWERTCKRTNYTLQTEATLKISNFDVKNLQNQLNLQELKTLVTNLKSEAKDATTFSENEMITKLDTYFERKDCHISLITKYKIDILNSIKAVHREMLNLVTNEIEIAFQLKLNTIEVDNIHMKQKDRIEQQVLELLKNFKQNTELSDDQLKAEFDKMWNHTVVNIKGLKERDVASSVLLQLKENFQNRNMNEEIQNVTNLLNYGTGPFKAKTKHLSRFANFKDIFRKKHNKKKLQTFAEGVIDTCTRVIKEFVKSNTDYHESLSKELLEKVDSSVKQNYKDLKTNQKFEFDLKLHICGIASREFLEMHRTYLASKDPLKRLESFKSQYLADFMDLYRSKDHCKRKANVFTQVCLQPGIIDYINSSIGSDIVDTFLKSSFSGKYTSQSLFQYSMVKELLEKDDFQTFVKYLSRYEICVKDQICNDINECFSNEIPFAKLRNKYLEEIILKIKLAIENALCDITDDVRELVKIICSSLKKDMAMSMGNVDNVLFQINTKCHPFTESLIKSLTDLQLQMQDQFAECTDIVEALDELPIKPQIELFKQMYGCEEQCPFCKVPCEAGSKEHKEHHAAVHRPQALGSYRYITSQVLTETLCTSDVYSKKSFQNVDTTWKLHPYKEYRTYYPDWHIPPDPSIEASDCWKYVLAKYNEEFAKEYNAKPAKIPTSWESITKEQALEGLKEAFNVK